MAVIIMVTDNRGLSTFVATGMLPRGSDGKPTKAEQLQAWVTQAAIHRALLKLTRSTDQKDIWISPKAVQKSQPFADVRGDCLFEKPGRLCFSSQASGSSPGDLLLVLSGFPATLQARKRGSGKLLPSRSGGGLASGQIDWDIIAVNEPIGSRVGNSDSPADQAAAMVPGISSKATF